MLRSRPGTRQAAVRRLRAAHDQARVRVTVPRTPQARAWLRGRSQRPAVDPTVWAHHVAYADRRCPRALNALVTRYRPYAESTAKRLYRRGEPLEDLVQVSLEALLLALRRFDPDRGTPFLAFAKPTIVGSLRRHFRDAGWAIRVPRRVHELAGPMRIAAEFLRQDLGREPSAGEIADFLGVAPTDVDAAARAHAARRTVSIDAPDPATGATRHDIVGFVDRDFDRVENREALAECLEALPEEERQLLRRYFVERMTQSEIAAELGCSQMQVSRLLARSIRRLRHDLVGD